MSGHRPPKRGGFHNHYDNDRPQKFSRAESANWNSGSAQRTYDNVRRVPNDSTTYPTSQHGPGASKERKTDPVHFEYVDRLPDPSKCERCKLSKEEVDAGLIALLAQVETEETSSEGNKDILRSARELRQLLSAPPALVRERPPAHPPIEPSLHTQVFTHASLYEKPKRIKGLTSTDDLSYERFEFIGDAYLELMATRLIAHRLPALDVPAQAHFREQLIRNDTLSKFSRGYGLPDRLHHGHLKREGKAWDKITADIFEAYVAAVIYTDPVEGFLTAEKWMTQLWAPQMLEYRETVLVENVAAQEELNKLVLMNHVKLVYIDEKNMENTADGKQKFMQGVYLTGWGNDQAWLGSGFGQNKQQAAMNAAQDALKRDGVVLREAARKKREFLVEQEVVRERHREDLRERVRKGDGEALGELRRLIANDVRIKAKLAKKGDQDAVVKLEELRREEEALEERFGKVDPDPVVTGESAPTTTAAVQDAVPPKSEPLAKLHPKKKKEAKPEEAKPMEKVKQSAEDFLNSIISGGKVEAKSSAGSKDGSSYLEREQKRKEKEERKKRK
ncbi:hypothetical protein GRF29_161g1402376 [Pseudopithomyces chartarum]|uniref:RNase III domain-containing protein n=1 Tax=Pseudopithomyces chartarum TaxID=1892770 RepID=A0AAN6RDH1_9PLEO|nr:hypothetical protein GRF29_161g1402376 [Pseudopithomyces chartarum]